MRQLHILSGQGVIKLKFGRLAGGRHHRAINTLILWFISSIGNEEKENYKLEIKKKLK